MTVIVVGERLNIHVQVWTGSYKIYFMMMYFLCIFLVLLTGCRRETQKKEERDRFPVVPPSVVESGKGPWLGLQSNEIVVDDFVLQDQRALAEIEQKFGLSADKVIKILLDIQKPLDKFGLLFPTDRYSVLTIPDSQYEFKVVKRIYLNKTPLGSPVFLDVRKFDSKEGVQDWHFGLIHGEFERIEGRRYPVFVGRGDHNQEQYDPSHGFSVKDRGLFLAFIEDGDKLYVLYADAPWETLEKHKNELISVVPFHK